MIGYSNQSQIVRSKTSLDSSREVEYGCGISFVNYLYLVPLIIGQSFCATWTNQTGPMCKRAGRGPAGCKDMHATPQQCH